jgi:hypothetical protein
MACGISLTIFGPILESLLVALLALHDPNDLSTPDLVVPDSKFFEVKLFPC